MVCTHHSRRALVVITVAFAGFLLTGDSLRAAPPMSREDFAKSVPRGLSKEKVYELLGKPAQERQNKKDGLTELLYKEQVRAAKTGRPENVTVIIFDEYKTVQSVRWADGTLAE
jgi:outer membrane protein assembly factor BamE (lipoprotein component of BamABCDE complex)